jgi:hypothetical protein
MWSQLSGDPSSFQGTSGKAATARRKNPKYTDVWLYLEEANRLWTATRLFSPPSWEKSTGASAKLLFRRLRSVRDSSDLFAVRL